MQANTGVVRRYQPVSLYPDWAEIKDWARKMFTGERIAEIAAAASILAILALIFFSLSNAMQNMTYAGLEATGFGFTGIGIPRFGY